MHNVAIKNKGDGFHTSMRVWAKWQATVLWWVLLWPMVVEQQKRIYLWQRFRRQGRESLQIGNWVVISLVDFFNIWHGFNQLMYVFTTIFYQNMFDFFCSAANLFFGKNKKYLRNPKVAFIFATKMLHINILSHEA